MASIKISINVSYGEDTWCIESPDLRMCGEVTAVSSTFTKLHIFKEMVFPDESKLKWEVKFWDIIIANSDTYYGGDYSWIQRMECAIYAIIKFFYSNENVVMDIIRYAILYNTDKSDEIKSITKRRIISIMIDFTQML